MLFILIDEVRMVSFEQKKTYLGFIFIAILLGLFAFGIASSVSKITSSKKLKGCVFSQSVAIVVDAFYNSNLVEGNYVVVADRSIDKLCTGDYVVINDFIGATVRADNCGKLVKIETVDGATYLFVRSEISGEMLRLPKGLYLGKVEYHSQLHCGWLRFIASSWANLVFILVPFVGVWWFDFRLRSNFKLSEHNFVGAN